jgi:hypothetical protein
MMAGLLVAAILCLLPTLAVARGRSTRAVHATYSLPVRDGVGSFTVSLPDRNPPVPPLVLYDAHPANLDCRATNFGYSVSQLDPNQTAIGTLSLRMRCKHVPAGARISLKLRDPIVLRVPIRRSSGRIAFSLDKPPGNVLPLVSLRTYRIGGPCRTRRTTLRVRRLRLDFTSDVTCGRLTRHSTAVLTIGGLLRSRSASGTSLTARSAATLARARSAATPLARAAAAGDTAITCTGQGTVTATCRQSLSLWPWRTIAKSYNFDGCPAGYRYTPNGWPGWLFSRVPDVGPTADGDFFGVWTFTNWAWTYRTLNLTWFCGLSAPQPITPPAVTGAAVVGNSLSCTNGTWNGYPNRFDNYQWLRDGDVVSASQQYTVASGDYHHSLQCSVLAHNAVGSTTGRSLSTPQVVKAPPQSIGTPSLLKWDGLRYSIAVPGPGNSTVRDGSWLLCSSSASSWIDAHSVTFQWLLDGRPIAGASRDQYHVPSTQVGHQLSCRATATNQAGSASAVSASTGPIVQGGPGIL